MQFGDGRGFSPLYRAVVGPPGTVGQHGDNEHRVLSLLDAGAKVNVRTRQGWTPLMAAGSTGQPAVMRLLLRRGADPYATDKEGNSPRDWALHCVKGHDNDPVLSVKPSPACTQCAALLDLATSTPWRPATHATYPDAERQRAVDMLWLGCALAKRLQMRSHEFTDCWEAYVMPLLVVRPRCCNRRWQTDPTKIGTFEMRADSLVLWNRRPRADLHLLLLPIPSPSHQPLPRLPLLRAHPNFGWQTVDRLAALESAACSIVRGFVERGLVDEASAARIVVDVGAEDPLLCVHVVMGSLLLGVEPTHFDWPRFMTLADVIARLVDEMDRGGGRGSSGGGEGG